MINEIKKNSERKIKRKRSAAYPAISLETAIELSEKLITAYNESPFSRGLAVEAIGHKTITGTSAQKVAALVHYGLLERGANTYKNTDLASRITDFTSEEDKNEALIVAVMNPKLFAALIEENSGKAIPGLLKNILVSEYKINRKVAKKVAETFEESIKFAGIYINNVVTKMPIGYQDNNNSKKSNTSNRSLNLNTGNNVQGLQINNSPHSMQSITLPSGIIISYPENMSYLFAIGKFSIEILNLDKAITGVKPKENYEHRDNNTLATK